MVTRFSNRIKNRSKSNIERGFKVKETRDPIDTLGPSITAKTINWYGVPDRIEVRFEGSNKSKEYTRDEFIDKYNKTTFYRVPYDNTLPKYKQGSDYLAKQMRAGQLSKFIEFMNYPLIDGKRATTVSHETNMLFRQAEDDNWDRKYSNPGGKYDEYIGQQFMMDYPGGYFKRGPSDSDSLDSVEQQEKVNKFFRTDVKSKYTDGIEDALDVIKKTKGNKVDKRNALALAIDQEGPDWAKKEGMLLVNTKLKNFDPRYSRDIHKDIKNLVDKEVGGNHKDPIEFKVLR